MSEEREQALQKIRKMGNRMRKHLLDTALEAGAGSSHLGGGLSIIDITATLYGAIMRFQPSDPQWPGRDRFILSKGHGVLGYYTALVEAGLLAAEELMTFEKADSALLGHPVINRAKGIEFSNGSLGMGLALGIGVAVAAKRRGHTHRVYVLMGDGECNEGSVWESAMAAPHFKLTNLIAIVDRNNLQQTGSGIDILNLGDMAAKWRSFGWNVVEVDGHNVGELYDTFRREPAPAQPLAVIAHTVKGKGVSFAEGNNAYHHAVLTRANYDLALAELRLAEP